MAISTAIITSHFNPCGYHRPRQNLVRFLDGLGWLSVEKCFRVVEASFGPPSGYGPNFVAGTQNFLWQKERLINIGIEQLPPEYDAVAWIDGDLLFDNPDWYSTTCEMLEHTPVLQLFETIAYLGKDGAPESQGHGMVAAGDRMTFRAPGGAIACRRELLGPGLYDRDPLGHGDSIFMNACLGKRNRYTTPSIEKWCQSFGQHQVGFVPGGVRHLYHGSRAGRDYQRRAAILTEHSFDPETDVRVGENGLLEWASDKPALHQAVRQFFENRNEDD